MSKIIPKSKVIETIRLKKGLSIRGLSLKTKTHYSTLSKAENAIGSVTPRTAKAICEALEQDFDMLFEIVDDVKGA